MMIAATSRPRSRRLMPKRIELTVTVFSSSESDTETEERSKYNIFNPKLIKKNILVDSFNISNSELTNPIIINFQKTEFMHREDFGNMIIHTSSFSKYQNVRLSFTSIPSFCKRN